MGRGSQALSKARDAEEKERVPWNQRSLGFAPLVAVMEPWLYANSFTRIAFFGVSQQIEDD